MLSYKSWIGEDGAMLSSEQAFSSPLTNAATRRLSQQAISTLAPDDVDGDTIQIDIDLGSDLRSIGCVALLGIEGFDVTGTTIVTVIGDSALTYTVPAAGSVGAGKSRNLVFYTPVGWLESVITITIQNGSVPIKIGRIWVGPVFGLLPTAALSTAPQIAGAWTQGYIDRGMSSASPGGEVYPRASVRLRTLDCEYADMEYAPAFGSNDSVHRDSLDWIGENYGNTEPMVMCARTSAITGGLNAFRVRANHVVYGRQTNPWQIQQQANEPMHYRCALRFEGEG